MKNKTKTIELTQGFVTTVEERDYERLSQHKWRIFKDKDNDIKYARRNTPIKDGKRGVEYMHREILAVKLGRPLTKKEMTDHINKDGLDNRRGNLRVCSPRESCIHTGSRKGSSSQYKGVSWNKKNKKWEVKIRYRGKKKFLGYFDDEKEAARAYDKMAKKLRRRFKDKGSNLDG